MSKSKKIVIKVPRNNGRDRMKAADRGNRAPTQYEELLNNIYDAVLITDADASVIEINRRALDYFLYEKDELLTLDVLDLIPDADISFLKTLKNMPDAQYALIETRCLRKDGTFFPAEIAVKSLGGQGNNLSFFVRNISKRKEAEARLNLVNNAVKNSLTAIVITDVAGVIEYGNPAAIELFGLPPETDNNHNEISRYFLEKDRFRKAFDSLKSLESWQGELTIQQESGRQISTGISAVPNYEGDVLTGFVFSLVDITLHKAAELQRQINERNAAMIATLGATCHHLSQPATVLCVNAELLDSHPHYSADPELKSMAGQISAAANDLHEKLRELNAITLYRTENYIDNFQEFDDISNTILKIGDNGRE